MATIVTRSAKGSALTWQEGDDNFTNLNNDKIEAVVDDATPSLGGNLDVGANSITTTTVNGDITITANGTGLIVLENDVTVGTGSADAYITSSGAFDLVLATNDGTNSGYIKIIDGANQNIQIEPNGTGKIDLDGLLWPTADGTNGQALITNGAGQLSFSTVTGGITLSDDTSTNATRYIIFDDSTSGSQSAMNVSSTKLTFNPSTGIVTATGFSGAVNGTVGATTPNTGTFTTLTINAANDLRLADSDSSNYVGFKAPATVSANKIWTLPSGDGTNGQVLTTNGSGTLSWATASGGSATLNEFVIQISSTGATNISGNLYKYALSETYDSNANLTITSDAFDMTSGNWIIHCMNRSLAFTGSATVNIYLRNTTDSTDAFTITSINMLASGTRAIVMPESRYVSLAATKTMEIRIDIGSNNTTDFNNMRFLFRKVS